MGAWEYAIDNFDRFLNASILSDVFTVGDRTSLGTPFVIPGSNAQAYYFPVISDDIIIGTFRVFADIGQTTGRWLSYLYWNNVTLSCI